MSGLEAFGGFMKLASKTIVDCDKAESQRIYSLTGAANKPDNMVSFMLVCIAVGDFKLQLASDDTTSINIRTSYKSVWSSWKTL